MTKLPPGGANFPDNRQLKATPELHRKNFKHAARWLNVRAMDDLSAQAFKQKYKYKKTLSKIYELVAEAEPKPISPQAIKKSCDLVDAELEAGNGYKFFVADWSSRKLGKKRPRSP